MIIIWDWPLISAQISRSVVLVAFLVGAKLPAGSLLAAVRMASTAMVCWSVAVRSSLASLGILVEA
jgi:hypothetical protein